MVFVVFGADNALVFRHITNIMPWVRILVPQPLPNKLWRFVGEQSKALDQKELTSIRVILYLQKRLVHQKAINKKLNSCQLS